MASLEQRIAQVEGRQRDLEAELRRLKTEILDNVDERNAVAVRLVEKMITQEIGSLRADVEEIKLDGKIQLSQLTVLTEAAEERGRRKQREEEIALRGLAVKVEESDATVEAMRANTKVTRWKGAAVAFAIVAAAIGGLIGAAIGSHH